MKLKNRINFDVNNACKNCLLPEPFAHLNEDKLCFECVGYKIPNLKGRHSLEQEFKEIRGKGVYDCMVGISGGRDSTYALYVAKKELGLNVLAFHFNNEFVHPQAITNMEAACKKLDVDFISIGSKHNICHKIVADQIRIAAQFGPAALKAHLCGPCNVGGFLVGKKLSMEKKIPIILLGNSEEELMPDYLKVGKHVPLKKKIINKKAPYFLRSHYYRLRQRLEFSSSIKEIANVRFNAATEYPQQLPIYDTKIIALYNYIKWDRKIIVDTIKQELGWKKPEDQTSSWRYDCYLLDLINYLWTRAIGLPKVFFGYVKMVRSGAMTKEEALKQLSSTDWGTFTSQMEDVLRNDLNIKQKYINIIKSY